MNEEKNYKCSLALAGVFQSAALVRDLARTGKTEKAAFDTCIQSIYRIDAMSVEQVYGGEISGLRLGLQELVNFLNHTRALYDRELARYLIGLMHLERKMIHAEEIRQKLRLRIKHAFFQANYFSSSPKLVIKSLADIYIATLGSLPFRLYITGNAKYLSQPETVNRIRAALLAGVRSVVLWRQVGGARWQLFLKRNGLIKTGKDLLSLFN